MVWRLRESCFSDSARRAAGRATAAVECRGHSKPLAADGQREASEIGRGRAEVFWKYGGAALLWKTFEPGRLLPYHWCADKMKHTSDKILQTLNLRNFISPATYPAQSVGPGRTPEPRQRAARRWRSV